jgi:cell division protein FtsB
MSIFKNFVRVSAESPDDLMPWKDRAFNLAKQYDSLVEANRVIQQENEALKDEIQHLLNQIKTLKAANTIFQQATSANLKVTTMEKQNLVEEIEVLKNKNKRLQKRVIKLKDEE